MVSFPLVFVGGLDGDEFPAQELEQLAWIFLETAVSFE